MSEPWRNRIVGHREVDPATLVPNPGNWRLHPDHQRASVTEALQRVGWVGEVLVNVTTGHVVDGHLRLEEALSNGEPLVPITEVELTEEEERLVLATLDPLAGLAVADTTALQALIDGLDVEGTQLGAMLADLLDANSETVLPEPAESTSEDFWPRISVPVPPELFERWSKALATLGGELDRDNVAALLDRAKL